MATDGTLGSMLQGVSQQPPAVRPSGKVSEQINFVSDVVQGLSARPALHEIGISADNAVTDYTFMDIELNEGTFIVGTRPGALIIWDAQTATPYSIVEQDSSLAYIGSDMRSYVFENRIYLSNRDTVVAKSASIDTSNTFTNVGAVTLLGGLFLRDYSVTIRWQDGSTSTALYTTPNGTDNGHADETSAKYIANQLYTQLQADPNWPVGVVSELSGSTFYVRDPAGQMTITVDDDEDQTAIRSFTSSTDKVENLPSSAPHGTLVKITGADEGSEDDYYLRFNSALSDVVGTGFGDEGIWEEWVNDTEVVSFDLSTMPHILEKTGPTEFTLRKGDWLPRRTGDEESNPFPSMVGYPIRDLGGFQSRLVLVAGPWITMSVTNDPTDLFKKTILTELDTDPINITSTEEGAIRFDWIIPFDRDLVLIADPGEGQYIITGSTKLTPGNASVVKTTAFEVNGSTKPVETGRTIVFPFKSGRYSGLKEFFTNDEVTTNGADTLTEAVDRYIIGLVTHMAGSTNFNHILLKTDEPGYENIVWVYKYLWQNTDKVQSSWSKWEFSHAVEHFFFKGSELVVVLSEDGSVPDTKNYLFNKLDLDRPLDLVAGYHISLDRQYTVTADALSKVTLPFTGARFVQGTGCATPGRPVTATGETAGGEYTFDASTVPEGAEVIGGLRYTRLLKPTMPFARKSDGEVAPRTHIVVTSFLLEYEDTGYIETVMTSKYRQDPITFTNDFFATDDDPNDPNGIGVRSGILDIPWGERSDWSELTIQSEDVRPTTFIELEWVGQKFKGTKG